MQQLQKLKVDIFEHKRCNLYYPGSYKETYELCAGQAAGGPINGQCRVRICDTKERIAGNYFF